MALSGNELVDIHKPDAKGNPSAQADSVALSQLRGLPAATTIDVTPARTNGNQIAPVRPVKLFELASVGANDTVEVRTPVTTTAVSASKQAVRAWDVSAFVS